MFKIYETENGVTVLVLEGRLTVACIPAPEEVMQALNDKCVSRLVLDLTSVTYIGTQAFGYLLDAWNKTSSRDGKTCAAVSSPKLREAFEVVRFDKFFEIHDSMDQAVNAFS